ncbi:MAG: hypothetical protein D6760_03680 [Deltaproteobacteria bacterium]|nr:MAG: hypothetical protein D6760_03675 [Deltaproteobacteria bacterium]RMF24272.1 MAG: hypothetical protein D6760_03680 [Deltaproteobacteria bacterium]
MPMDAMADRVIDELKHCDLLQQAFLTELRALLVEKPGEADTRWIAATVERLLDTLAREMSLKDDENYLEPVLEKFPSWAPRVDQLRAEKQQLLEQLRAMRQELTTLAGDQALRPEFRERIRGWVERLSEHKRKERELILEADTLDVGQGE